MRRCTWVPPPLSRPLPDGGGNLLFLDHPGGVLPDAGSSHLRVPHLRTEAAGLPGVSSPAGAGLRHFRLDGRLVREGSPVWLADVQSLSWEAGGSEYAVSALPESRNSRGITSSQRQSFSNVAKSGCFPFFPQQPRRDDRAKDWR